MNEYKYETARYGYQANGLGVGFGKRGYGCGTPSGQGFGQGEGRGAGKYFHDDAYMHINNNTKLASVPPFIFAEMTVMECHE